MQGYFIIFALALLVLCVLLRARQMKTLGMRAFHFGEMDKSDFFIPPFVALYFYLIIANTFHLPKFGEILGDSPAAAWVGAGLCLLAPLLFIWGMVSFKRSFRVGIDMKTPGSLVTSGAFALSRNPLYVAFFMILTGTFLIFPTWIFFAYLLGGLWLIDRQVNLEENALRDIYGEPYNAYCQKVRRYL